MGSYNRAMASSVTLVKHSSRLRCSFLKLCIQTSTRSQHSLVEERLVNNDNVKEISYVDGRSGENVPDYPAIKPKYPPGRWGKMDHKYAWLWNSAKENQASIPDVQGRIDALVEKELSALVLEPINDHPASLQFRQYVTKTEMRPWEEVPWYRDEPSESERKASSAIDQLKKDISDFILMEHEVIQRPKMKTNQTQMCHSLIRLISNSLIAHLGKQKPHLKTCQYDENVLVSSLWDRHGIERKRRKFTSDSDVYIFDTVQDQRIVSKGYFQSMLRSHQPLPLCVPRDEGISVTSSPPQLKFKPSVYGHEKALPKKLDSFIAGHRLGDPCEFGLVGMLSTCDTHSVNELNEDVLKTIVEMFALEPKDRGYNMKPTVRQQSEDTFNKQDYVPKKVVVEEVIEEEQYIVS
ncbi:28S ribosomal protein s30, mitochondrial-like [Plakobranchus ocellatus]|uniref:28S ribosomal protein s30, mitochondrial-like n=1 Tax=Plakobranchus ocellatus TaxID=259542 RepID=A0AAV3YC98_9GAST|nr:28S ribosomal protein s30, mitochondrial-like [Plakobranchus ocellatus]